MYARRNERVESCLLIRLLLFLYAERKAHGNQSKTVAGLILLHRIRKRDRCSERIFDADIYADSSYCARLYHLAVEEPEALQRCKQQGNDDSLKSKIV